MLFLNKNIDYKLYLVTDREVLKGRDLKQAVEDAILGGVTLVQIREKNCSGKDFLKYASEVKSVTDKYSIPLIVNDRVDIALAINAQGVHIGQNDMDAKAVRRIIGNDMILGVSASNKEEAIKAVKDGADYLGIGAMYTTNVKKDAINVNLNNLKEIVDNVSIPIVAIGGINFENSSEVLNVGIDGIAVVSSILAHEDVKKAANILLNECNKYLK